jgi:polyhydroxyalkanoate synthesis repressor PhaR
MPVLKRYANRKLYDTESKRYVTLEDLANFIRKGEEVKVVDHVTGEDLTSVTLFQIIFEEEKKIGGLLPQVFLSRLIRTGGETVSALRERLASLDRFQVVDEEIRRRVRGLVEQERIGEEEGRRMIDLLIRKPEPVRIPVQREEGGAVGGQDAPVSQTDPAPNEVDPVQLQTLQQQVALLEQELDRLIQTRSAPPQDLSSDPASGL